MTCGFLSGAAVVAEDVVSDEGAGEGTFTLEAAPKDELIVLIAPVIAGASSLHVAREETNKTRRAHPNARATILQIILLDKKIS
jgi:hypothetical protein